MSATEPSPPLEQELRYEVGISPDANCADVAALLEEFVCDEPAMMPLNLNPDEMRPFMVPWARDLLKYADMCVAAVDGTRIVGVALNFHEQPSCDDKDEGWLGCYFPTVPILAHQSFAQALDARADVCARYGVDRAFVIDTLACARDHRRRGVARRLVQLSLEVAASRGYEVATAFGSSSHSQRIFESLGFETLAEASVLEHPNVALFSPSHCFLHRRFVVYGLRLPSPMSIEQQCL